MPSPMGLRVVPRIADDLKVKAAKAVAAKNRKAGLHILCVTKCLLYYFYIILHPNNKAISNNSKNYL